MMLLFGLSPMNHKLDLWVINGNWLGADFMQDGICTSVILW
ncbi:hypothetical protein ADINL_0437 [Nitrincola lacisaponensis]|uniref:Uncharacterized protein n=1 Tax=Nitrincola lacisaponensis TaxID=267850 RepID=A0A063Y5W8_9GAMM|nr:hypothetical protein ADINL_0437 [Nitrincola lacisaponensis]